MGHQWRHVRHVALALQALAWATAIELAVYLIAVPVLTSFLCDKRDDVPESEPYSRAEHA